MLTTCTGSRKPRLVERVQRLQRAGAVWCGCGANRKQPIRATATFLEAATLHGFPSRAARRVSASTICVILTRYPAMLFLGARMWVGGYVPSLLCARMPTALSLYAFRAGSTFNETRVRNQRHGHGGHNAHRIPGRRAENSAGINPNPCCPG